MTKLSLQNAQAAVGPAHTALQDSRPIDARLLGKLLDVGVLVLDDARRCSEASDAACELLGVDDLNELRTRWETISRDLGIADITALDGETLQRRADVRTPAGVRGLRVEAHAIRDDGRTQFLLLLRERTRASRADRAVGLVAEALANRILLQGYLHQANGPLNNFKLTLALLSSAVERAESAGAGAVDTARWRRHIEVLLAETERVLATLQRMSVLAWDNDCGRATLDVGDLLRDLTDALRHEAALREVKLALELPAEPARVVANARALRYALLGFFKSLLDGTQATGSVTSTLRTDGADVLLHIRAQPTALPDALIRQFFRVTETAQSDHAAVVAGRIFIEADGGEVVLESAAGKSGFVIRMRGATPPPA